MNGEERAPTGHVAGEVGHVGQTRLVAYGAPYDQIGDGVRGQRLVELLPHDEVPNLQGEEQTCALSSR